MTPPPDLPEKDALIAALVARIEALVARIAELEAKLGLPPKTPDNSSVPPSKGQKPSEPSAPKGKAKPHVGAHRPLHANPTARRDVFASACQGCGADVSCVAQSPCEAYDRVEIPEIKPDVTRAASGRPRLDGLTPKSARVSSVAPDRSRTLSCRATGDLADALRGLPAEFTRYGIVLLGQSLGGNLILKFMGEGGHGLPILAAVAVSTPIDLAATCARMMIRRNFIYERYMLDAMKREALAPGAAVSAAERAAIAAAKNVFEFDDRFIAPRFGYRDAQDYYESNAAKHFLAGIARPTLVLHALDDPWIPAACYKAIDWSRLPMIEAVLTPGGGHLGFHGRGSRIPWHDRVTAWWLARRFRLGPN